MRKLGRYLFIVIVGLSLFGCAASETRSIVSTDDVPASKYRKVAVFIENLDESERPSAEQIVIRTLQGAGVNAASGLSVVSKRGNQLSEEVKAKIIQKEFDAVMYLTVLEKGLVEELVPNARFDGQMVNHNMLGLITVGHNVTDMYVIKPDGSVYQPVLALKTKVDLQDTKTNKLVWTSETISSGHAKVSNMPLLFGQASKQIVEKMRTDNAI